MRTTTVRAGRTSRVRWIVKLKGGIWWAIDTRNMRRVRFGSPELARNHAVSMNAVGDV